MVGVAADSQKNRPNARQSGWVSRKFWTILLAGSIGLLLAGVLGFGYLRVNSPLSLLTYDGRPVAAASEFVPVRSPVTFSLLTSPDRLVALQQAVVPPERQAQARREIEQVQQNVLAATGLSYQRDIRPWLGEEVTFACTDLDLDQDVTNGAQPGYLLVLEMAPGRQTQAQDFLQRFWQQQALGGNPPQRQQINGVRLLSGQPMGITTANALVGDRFVIFSNDIRALRHSIQSAQTAQNLAQSVTYRQAIADLPTERIGLAYLDTRRWVGAASIAQSLNREDFQLRDLSNPVSSSRFVAIGIGLNRTGLTISAGQSSQKKERPADAMLAAISPDLLAFLPADSEIAIAGPRFNQLASFWAKRESLLPALPEFLKLPATSADRKSKDAAMDVNPSLDRWPPADYALARVGTAKYASQYASRGRAAVPQDWILSIRRDDTYIQALDRAATAAGYSVVPVALGDETVTAWTRFKPRSRRQSGSGLETEVLGLHLQRDAVEIFASSLSAMESAIAAPADPLLSLPTFAKTKAMLSALGSTAQNGYGYANWNAIAPGMSTMFPLFNSVQTMAGPLTDHIHTVSAALDDDTTRIFLQFSD